MKNVFLSFILFGIPLNDASSIEIQDDQGKAISSIEKEAIYYTIYDPLFLQNHVVRDRINDIKKLVNQPMRNARFTESGKIEEAREGKVIDAEKLEELLLNQAFQDIRKPIRLTYKTIAPKVTKEDLLTIEEKELGSFETYYDKDYHERSTNIQLAAQAIDYHVIAPEESFSFNDVVGERTAEKGYQKAPVIVKGELSEDIGGGICQLSSTLFNAIDLPGIDIKKRYSHSKEVPYVPKGKDAAVSWNGPDFVFVNEYDSPILLKAKAKSGVLSVKVYGQASIQKLK